MRIGHHRGSGCVRKGAKSYVKPVSAGKHGPERSASGGEDLLALLAQLALRPDVTGRASRA